MTTATGDKQSAVLEKFASTAVSTSLSVFEMLSHEDRAVLKGMLCEFLDADDPEERREVFISIVEHVAPARYFEVYDSVTLDEWLVGDPKANAAVGRLTEQKRKFAEAVAGIMAEQGLTQTQLAERLEVTQPTIAAMLKGQHKPQPRTLKKLADALGVSIDRLWPPLIA